MLHLARAQPGNGRAHPIGSDICERVAMLRIALRVIERGLKVDGAARRRMRRHVVDPIAPTPDAPPVPQ
jgi:hypothetical protein